MRQIERTLELDPLVARYKALYGVDLLFVRRFDDAITAARDALQTSPRLPGPLRTIAVAFHQKGMYEETLGAEKALRAALGDVEGEHILQNGYSEGGYREAMHRLAQLEADPSRRTRTRFMRAARLFLRAEDGELALECLERPYVNRDPNLPYLGLPTFDSVRDDPRFKDLLRRVNLPMWIEEG